MPSVPIPAAVLLFFALSPLIVATNSPIGDLHLAKRSNPSLETRDTFFDSSASGSNHRRDEITDAPKQSLEKRGMFDGLFCGIGVQSSCSHSVDTTSDIRNCGRIGNICPTSYANGAGSVSCTSSQCVSSCKSGFGFSTVAQGCINTNIDPANCGGVGQACNFPNGIATCSNGRCQLAGCAAGFKLDGFQCTPTSSLTDVNKCGVTQQVCKTADGAASVACIAGQCVMTGCLPGYIQDGNSNQCRLVKDLLNDPNNCGAPGRQCPAGYMNGQGSVCRNGICQPDSCSPGHVFDPTISACRNVLTDPKNCGGVGVMCSAPNTVAGCSGGQCTVVSCVSPAKLVNGVCTTSASARARARRSGVKPPAVKLCPGSESACPIADSISFATAQANGFSSFRVPELFPALQKRGGYECLDTAYALDSCGGCASMGEGQNCQQIPRAKAVGCDLGKCYVMSCESGFKPSWDGRGCVRIVSPAQNRKRRGNSSHAPHARSFSIH